MHSDEHVIKIELSLLREKVFFTQNHEALPVLESYLILMDTFY